MKEPGKRVIPKGILCATNKPRRPKKKTWQEEPWITWIMPSDYEVVREKLTHNLEVKNMSYQTYEVRVHSDGTIQWRQNDLRHREDGPAIERPSGTKKWFKNGQLHREDGPAIERSNGSKHWYKNGQRHREDGPAIEYPDGTKHWFKNGKRHREDGPAIEYSYQRSCN